MFNNLLESNPKKPKTFGSTIVSFTLHSVIIFLAVEMTLKTYNIKENVQETVNYVNQKQEEVKPLIAKTFVTPVFNTLTAPINVPSVLPDINFQAKLTDEKDFTGIGTEIKKEIQHYSEVNINQPLTEAMVEKPVLELSNSQHPRYPDVLKSAGVEGEVLVQFVVDTAGKVEINTFKVLSTNHELFAVAIRSALPGMKFLPAEIGTKKVRQLVQQSFIFKIAK